MATLPLALVNRNADLPFADFKLYKGEYIVGRSLNCNLPICDTTISRQHARLVVDGNSIHVTDMGSRNGTFIQGERIQSGTVTVGQEVRFGRVLFRVDEMSRYLPPANLDELRTAIIREGSSQLLDAPVRTLLTPSKMRVLACVLEGMSEKEAARKIGVSHHTVHNHIRDIYAHWNVRSRGELMAKFIPQILDPVTGLPTTPPQAGPVNPPNETEPELDVRDD